jgi:P-type Cu+ transporter
MNKKNHKISTFVLSGNPFYFWFDVFTVFASALVLTANLLGLFRSGFGTIIFIIVALMGLGPVLLSAFRALVNKKLTIDLLASVALIFSLLSQEFHSAVFISLMLASARFFAYFTDKRTKLAIQKLLKLKPEKVLVKVCGGVVEKRVEEVAIGDLVVLGAGERAAVDGVVVEGGAIFDQSSLTGESASIEKKVGDEIFSSTLNVSGSLIVKTTKVGKDTTFAKILNLIEESQKGKAPVASIADKFIDAYIVVTVLGSILVYVFTHNLNLVLAILLVTCADDLAIAIPLAFIASIGTAAKKGIIIKGASFIEALPKMKVMFFDKTGTLTEGKPKVKNVFIFKDYIREEFLGLMAALVQESTHPASKAIYGFIKENNVFIPTVNNVREETGMGMAGIAGKNRILAGNANFLESQGVVFSEEDFFAMRKEKELGRMLVVLARGNLSMGFISLSDSVRHNAKFVIEKLREGGIEKIVMLTGDSELAAKDVVREIGITEFRANLLPKDKVDFIKKSINKDYKVGMLGDGVNDAASLALADISFAMGAIGSDVAIESADIALMKDDLSGVVDAIKIGRKTMTVVKQDMILWGVINFIGLLFVFGGIFGPAAAAGYNFITDFIPPLNSLRLFNFRKRQ